MPAAKQRAADNSFLLMSMAFPPSGRAVDLSGLNSVLRGNCANAGRAAEFGQTANVPEEGLHRSTERFGR